MKLVWYEFQMDFLRTVRYKMGFLSDLAIYTLLLCFFLLSNTGISSSENDYKSLLILGYTAWTLSTTAISTISYQLLTELQCGTLFFKLNSRLPLPILYLGDLASSILVQIGIVVLYAVVTRLIFGVHYLVTFPILAAFLISTLGMYGIGLMIAGLSLYYKRIGAVVLLIEVFLLFVTDTLPTSPAIIRISQILPLTLCNTIIRNSFFHENLRLPFLFLFATSLFWFSVGWVIFSLFLNHAKEKGNLLFY